MPELQSVITMANSIIGVSVLAMPFCFKQCGIILATLMIVLSGFLVKMTCHLLVKSSIISRRRNYEVLAFETFGAPGKMAVEMSMIGFMVGTCIAFFVVIGDLAPPIIAYLMNVVPSENLRIVTLLGICIFIVLPLTMLRNLESLFAVSTASILFYCFVMLHIIFSARSNIFDGSWTNDINWWRTAGIFQCLPIFCMALSCQCQVFEIYESLPDPSLGHMNEVVKGAVNICSGVYIAVGLFGNIACSGHEIGGNILTVLPPSGMVDFVKFGFVLSVAVSFPLVIFPCRTSIHSLIFRKGSSAHSEMISNFIPPVRFNVITISVVFVTLVMGILLPDIEIVLGIVGSTIGNVICIIFPAVIFLKLTSRNTTERLAAQGIFVIGLLLMVLGTYVNLYEADSKAASKPEIDILPPPNLDRIAPDRGDVEEKVQVEFLSPDIQGKPAHQVKHPDEKDKYEIKHDDDPKRQEPIEPVPPLEFDDEAKKKVEDVVGNPDADETKKKTEDSEKILKKYKTVGLSEDKKVDVNDKKVDEDLKEKEVKAERLIEELEKQKNEHKQILLEQKQVLEEMRHHVDEEKKARAAMSGNDVQQLLPYVQPPEAAGNQQPRAAFGEQQLQPEVEVRNVQQHEPDLLQQQQQYVPQQDKVMQPQHLPPEDHRVQQQLQPHPEQPDVPLQQPVKLEIQQPQQEHEQIQQVYDHQPPPPQQNFVPQQPIHQQFVEQQQPVNNHNVVGQQPPEQNLQHQQELLQVQQEQSVKEKHNQHLPLQNPLQDLDPDTLESKKEVEDSNEKLEKKEMKRDLERVEQILDSRVPQSQGKDLKYFENDKNCLNCAAKVLPLQLSQIV